VYRAHRVAWELTFQKEVPRGKVVRHTCDNPVCVNPQHLELGTQLDNVRDRVERGREGDRSGIKNGRAKVTPDVVREIRRRASIGETYASIGRDVDLCGQVVSKIVKRRLWANVT
jgi:hypothetical protein